MSEDLSLTTIENTTGIFDSTTIRGNSLQVCERETMRTMSKNINMIDMKRTTDPLTITL